ncbi:MAG: MFS transporter small subunit [Gammaproteobacteria bacterium]
MKNPEHYKPTPLIVVILFWLYVAFPLTWGVWSTLQKALALFH